MRPALRVVADEPRFLQVAVVARMLGLSPSLVRKLIAEGILPAVRATIPGRMVEKKSGRFGPPKTVPYLIRPADVEKLIAGFEIVKPKQ